MLAADEELKKLRWKMIKWQTAFHPYSNQESANGH